MKKATIILAFLMLFTTSVDAQRNKRSAKKQTTKKVAVTKSKAADSNSAEAKANAERESKAKELFFTASQYLGGIGVAEDKAKGISILKEAADLGYAKAATEIRAIEICKEAEKYMDGNGVRKDWDKAASLVREAANTGSAYGQRLMSICYYEGIGVKKDLSEYRAWVRKAAQSGDLLSQYLMASMLATGSDGMEIDYVEAARWYEAPAKAGDRECMKMLGAMYLLGKGVDIDKEKAAKLLRKAAEMGDEMAKKIVKDRGL